MAYSGDHDNRTAGKMQRVDTGAWEVPVVGVEYYDGIVNGTQAYYQRFTGSLGSGVNAVDLIASAAGWATFEGQGGNVTGTSTGVTDMSVPSYYSTNTFAVIRRLAKTTTDNIELSVGSSMDPCDYDVWVRYTLP